MQQRCMTMTHIWPGVDLIGKPRISPLAVLPDRATQSLLPVSLATFHTQIQAQVLTAPHVRPRSAGIWGGDSCTCVHDHGIPTHPAGVWEGQRGGAYM